MTLLRRYLLVVLAAFVGRTALAEDPLAVAERLHRAQAATSLDHPGIASWYVPNEVEITISVNLPFGPS